MARKPISQKLRFEVFKRDSFTCHWCGRSAPNVVLEVDHIEPVSKGGTNDIFNLITSCKECNRGKGARKIDDDSIFNAQMDQLKEINEKRKQLEMMVKWRKELSKFNDSNLEYVVELFEVGAGCEVSDKGRKTFKRLLKTYSLDEIKYAIDVSVEKYDKPEDSFNYIERVCKTQRAIKDKPYLPDLFYIRKVIITEFGDYYWPKYKILNDLERAHLNGVSITDLKNLVQNARNSHELQEDLVELAGGYS